MADEQNAEKKIIIDEDWKQQAKREKEALAAKEKLEKESKQEEIEVPEDEDERSGPLPRGNLAALISMLTTQTLFALGLLQIKGQEGREPDLDMARYNIDMLAALQEKTKGNLTTEEEAVLKNTLNDLQMGYVQMANQIQGTEPESGGPA